LHTQTNKNSRQICYSIGLWASFIPFLWERCGRS